jgi:hypothetical protein
MKSSSITTQPVRVRLRPEATCFYSWTLTRTVQGARVELFRASSLNAQAAYNACVDYFHTLFPAKRWVDAAYTREFVIGLTPVIVYRFTEVTS